MIYRSLALLFTTMILLMGCNGGGTGKAGKIDAGGDGTDADTWGDGGTTDGGPWGYSDADSDIDGDADADGDSEQCAATDHDISLNPINMLILLDRSRSMLNKVGDQTYAAITAEALKNVVATNEDKHLVNFGLSLFPSLQCRCKDEDPAHSDTTWCDSLDERQCLPTGSNNASPLVQIGSSNKDLIAAALDTIGTCGGTPICKSLEWAHGYLKNLATAQPEIAKYRTYVLLATDGAPNCNPKGHALDTDSDTSTPWPSCICTQDPGPCNFDYQCLDDKCTYNQAMRLNDDLFSTFVIGVGEDVAGKQEWKTVMTNIAEYGGTEKYFEARDPATLTAALEEITVGLLPCTFAVEWDTVPGMSAQGVPVSKACNKVQVFAIPDMTKPTERTELSYSWDCSQPNGWRWQGLAKQLDPKSVDTTPLEQCATIELCPGACQQLKSSTYQRITFGFGCGPGVVL